MSSRITRVLQDILGDASFVDRKDAIRVLKYLGFEHRYSHSTHHRWRHPPTGAIWTHSFRKSTQKIDSFQLKDLKTAIKTVIDKAKKENTATMIKPEKIILPEVRKLPKPQIVESRESVNEPKKLTKINKLNFPDEVAVVTLAYKNREITGAELSTLLNDSGYRGPSGQPFTKKNVHGITIYNPLFKKWLQNKDAGEPQPVRPVPMEETKNADILALVQAILDENKALKEEIEQLKSWKNRLKELFAG